MLPHFIAQHEVQACPRNQNNTQADLRIGRQAGVFPLTDGGGDVDKYQGNLSPMWERKNVHGFSACSYRDL